MCTSPLFIWTKLKKILIWTTKSGRTQDHKHTNRAWLFICHCNNSGDILLNWPWFLHYLWLQEVIQQQTFKLINKRKISLTKQILHILSSHEESLKKKRYSFIGMCCLFTWFNMHWIYVIDDIDTFTTLLNF